MTTKHTHHRPQQKKPVPVHVIEEEPLEEPLPELPLPPEPPPAVALPAPAPSPQDEAEAIVRALADTPRSRMGTSHGVELINAAKRWVAAHEKH